MTDEDLVRLYIETQSALYFSHLYNRYADRVYSKCISLLKDEMLAEDALQEIFLKIFLNLSKFGHQSKFSTWVYSVSYNYCIDFIRRQKKDRDLFSDNDIDTERYDVRDDIEDAQMLEMDLHFLQITLEKLAPDDKIVLLMKYHDDMSIKDICAALNKTESAIKMKLKRAKHRAREIYDELSSSI
jgi:RNA polymerase sigma-70 factor (ECF subfamily)